MNRKSKHNLFGENRIGGPTVALCGAALCLGHGYIHIVAVSGGYNSRENDLVT